MAVAPSVFGACPRCAVEGVAEVPWFAWQDPPAVTVLFLQALHGVAFHHAGVDVWFPACAQFLVSPAVAACCGAAAVGVTATLTMWLHCAASLVV